MSSPSTPVCVLCESKGVGGVFRCEGCSHSFCLQHTNEHRQYLTYLLKEITSEHDILLTGVKDSKQTSLLFDQVNQWEKDSIKKIQQTAENTRLQIQQLCQSQKDKTTSKFSQITNQLEVARKNERYVEQDLFRWKILLEQLQYDLAVLSPSLVLHQDLKHPLVNNIVILKKDQPSLLNEKLTSSSQEIQFDEDHHIAMYCGPHRTPAYVTGTQEYSSGQHQIRLFISKKTNEFILSFNIMPTSMPISNLSTESEYLTYGWQSNDCVNPSICLPQNEKKFQDLRGNTQFHITLTLDCDHKILRYYNEKTKRMREISIDENKCPLPWRLLFYLYDIGDSVRVLSSFPL